jgi:hypothetical protein
VRGRRYFVSRIQNLIRPRVARSHCKDNERSGKDGRTAHRNIEVPATDADCKADNQTDGEFHWLSPNTRQTLSADRSFANHAFALVAKDLSIAGGLIEVRDSRE